LLPSLNIEVAYLDPDSNVGKRGFGLNSAKFFIDGNSDFIINNNDKPGFDNYKNKINHKLLMQPLGFNFSDVVKIVLDESLNTVVQKAKKNLEYKDAVDYTADRGLDKKTYDKLATLHFIDRKENIIITGATGTGKSYLPKALGYQACIHIHKTKYYTMSSLFKQIQISKIQGSHKKSSTALVNYY